MMKEPQRGVPERDLFSGGDSARKPQDGSQEAALALSEHELQFFRARMARFSSKTDFLTWFKDCVAVRYQSDALIKIEARLAYDRLPEEKP